MTLKENLIEILNPQNQFNLYGYNEKFKLIADYFDKNKMQTSIVVITSSRKVYLEYSACRYIMLHIPFLWPIAPLLFFPLIAPRLGNIIYKKISKNRSVNGLSNRYH